MYYLHSRKMNHNTIPKISHSSTACPLELVMADLCGPFRSPSCSRAKYFLSSSDDIWIYSLKRKFDIFDTLIQFQREVKSMGLKILKCQSDGGEFTSEFIEYCRKNGIYREQTQARSPQQNGIVEQRNQSLLDMARCITTN